MSSDEQEKKKITTFKVDTFLSILNFLLGDTHKRNIAYNLQYLQYINILKSNLLDLGETSLEKSFRKTEIVVIHSIIECVLFDIIFHKDWNNELTKEGKWVDAGDNKIFVVLKDKDRVKVTRQNYEVIKIDKYTKIKTLLLVARKNQIIDEDIIEKIDKIKELRDFLHLKGLREIEYNIFAEEKLKEAKSTLLELIKSLSSEEQLENINNLLYFLSE